MGGWGGWIEEQRGGVIGRRIWKVERSEKISARQERTLGGVCCDRGGTSDWPLMWENRKWNECWQGVRLYEWIVCVGRMMKRPPRWYGVSFMFISSPAGRSHSLQARQLFSQLSCQFLTLPFSALHFCLRLKMDPVCWCRIKWRITWPAEPHRVFCLVNIKLLDNLKQHFFHFFTLALTIKSVTLSKKEKVCMFSSTLSSLAARTWRSFDDGPEVVHLALCLQPASWLFFFFK